MTDMDRRETPPAYIRRHWAKSDRREPARVHLLEHHLADVGACFEALLGQPTIRKRLARTGGAGGPGPGNGLTPVGSGRSPRHRQGEHGVPDADLET